MRGQNGTWELEAHVGIGLKPTALVTLPYALSCYYVEGSPCSIAGRQPMDGLVKHCLRRGDRSSPV